MGFRKTLVATGTLFFAAFSAQVGAWAGVLTTYEKRHFNGQNYSWFIDTAQRCYEFSCLDDEIASAQWEGLPQTRAFNGSALIAFYKYHGCTGRHVEWTTEDKNFPVDFALDKMNDGLASFMIWVDNGNKKMGVQYPCG
jgi:hypothetical protein